MAALMVSVSGVRGIVGPDLNPLVIGRWAAAFSNLLDPGPIVLGRDSRTTGDALADAAAAVLRACGREIWDLGIVPTPTVQLAVEVWGAAGGLILSASHNPAPWNALKFVDRDGSFLSPERFGALRERRDAEAGGFVSGAGYGGRLERGEEALEAHALAILGAVNAEAIRWASLRVVVDTGHGAGGVLLPRLARALDVELHGVRLEPTGAFSENPEPSAEGLKQILEMGEARTAAFVAMVDPDADRFAVALPGTEVVGEEWTLPLVASGRLRPGAGPLVTNLSTSTRCEAAAALHGLVVHRAPVGEAHVVAEMRRRGAALGGEGNGGVIDPAVHLGRDAAVAFARLCEAEATAEGGLRGLAAQLPPRFMSKAKLPIPGEGAASLEAPLREVLGPPDDRRDGLRWAFDDGFVHVRPSGTEPVVRAVVETGDASRTEETMRRLRDRLTRG